MAKRCDICGKGPVMGRTYTRKGKPKKEGGGGSHIARKNPRRFLPNLQPARVFLNGTIQRIRACTKCIKKGLVVRPSAGPSRTLAAAKA